MTGPLDIEADSYTAAVRALERSLSESRAQWDDAARRDFDLQHAEPLLNDAARTAAELSELARELKAATRQLQDSA